MTLITTETPVELFRELIDRAIANLEIDSSPESAHYLVQLLDSFVEPRRLYDRLEIAPDRPLAEIFCTGVSADGMRRFLLLKLSGDLSLFLSGFLSDSVKNDLVDVDYYGALGGAAYATAAGSCHSAQSATLFIELARNFARFADVLTEVSETCGLTDRNDLLRLYERWRRGGSARSARMLREMGIPLDRRPAQIQ